MLKNIHDREKSTPEHFRTCGGGHQLFGKESADAAKAYAERWADSDAGRAWKEQTLKFSAAGAGVTAGVGACASTESGSSAATTDEASNADLAERPISELNPDVLFPIGIEYTPPARGTWTIAHTPMLIPGLHEVYVCPEGCLRGVVLSAEEYRGLDRFHVISVMEPDLYNGSLESKIIDGTTEIIRKIIDEGKTELSAVMVTTACIHDLMGLNRNIVYKTLRSRFPDLDIVEGWMNCTMRMSHLHYEQVQWRQNYAALKPREQDPKAVNIIGSSFTLDRESELVKMLENSGFTVRDLPLCKTYDEFRRMAEASLNIRNWVMGIEACRDLEERLHQKTIHMPFPWTYSEIRRQLTELHNVTGAELPDFRALEQQAEEALSQTKANLQGTDVVIDGAGVMLPFQLAELLLDHGFHVTEIYADAVLPEDREAFLRLQKGYPQLKVSAMVNFRLRVRPRTAADEAKAAGRRLLAVGQKSAYFAGTSLFVDTIQNNGWYGYTGIVKLAEAMRDAMLHPKDAAVDIQIKARGCEFNV